MGKDIQIPVKFVPDRINLIRDTGDFTVHITISGYYNYTVNDIVADSIKAGGAQTECVQAISSSIEGGALVSNFNVNDFRFPDISGGVVSRFGMRVVGSFESGVQFQGYDDLTFEHTFCDLDGICEDSDGEVGCPDCFTERYIECEDFTCNTDENYYCLKGGLWYLRYCDLCLDAEDCGDEATVNNFSQKDTCTRSYTCPDGTEIPYCESYKDESGGGGGCKCREPQCPVDEDGELICDFDKICEGSEKDIGCPDCTVGSIDCDDFSCYIVKKKYCFNNELWDYKYCEICMDADECDPAEFNVTKYMPKIECLEFYTCPDGTEVPYCKWNFEGNYEIREQWGKFVGEDESDGVLNVPVGGGGPTCECEKPKCPGDKENEDSDDETAEKPEGPEKDEDEKIETERAEKETPLKESDKAVVVQVTTPNGEVKTHEISMTKRSALVKGMLKTSSTTAYFDDELVIEDSKLFLKTPNGKRPINIMPEEAIVNSEISEVVDVELKEEGERTIYSVRGNKRAKVLFILPVPMEVETKVDADTGEQISEDKPWWGFLTR